MGEELVRWFNERGVICTSVPSIQSHLDFEPSIRLFGRNSLTAARIGAFTYLSPNANAHKAEIGRYCSIGDRVTLGPTQHPHSWLTTSPVTYKALFDVAGASKPVAVHDEMRPLTIGNDVWIGSNSAVMGGVTIGDGAIIGYGSVVTKNVPPYAIVGGSPAKLIRMRFDPHTVSALIDFRWWQYDLVRLRGGAVNWSDPARALDTLRKRVEEGKLDTLPTGGGRIKRLGGARYGFEKRS